jgi:hAT family C-terminal dimerisation region
MSSLLIVREKTLLNLLQEAHDETKVSSSTNIFDNLPALKPREDMVLLDELDLYLSIKHDLEVKDGLRWWHERKHLYPHLYRMALDCLSIPGKL